MSKQTHTPGPWFTTGLNDANVSAMGSDELPIMVATCTPRIGGIAAGNARLIASAPDLLEAVVRLTNAIEALNCKGAFSGDYEAGLAAIAAATGEA